MNDKFQTAEIGAILPRPHTVTLPSGLVDRLVESFNRGGVDYCHWKSNFSLAQAVSGEQDLDLFVDRKSLPKATAVLMELGFKVALVRRGANLPGVFHYYGLDPQHGKIIHVHLFSSIVTGESFVKSHLLPFECMLLENPATIGRIKVASKPAELVVFVLRTFIKYGSLLDVLRLIGKSDDLRAELHWLRAGHDVNASLLLLKKYCPVVDEPLFRRCMQALDSGSSWAERLRCSRAVRWRLRVYAKYTSLARSLAYLPVLWYKFRRHFGGKQSSKMLQSGGAIIAFVGPDASGKSTLVMETGRWLGKVLAVRTVHVGKPPSAWLTMPVNLALRLARRLFPHLHRRRQKTPERTDNANTFRHPGEETLSLVAALRAVTLALDRRNLIIKSRRRAAHGEIVICDRYPAEIIGAMDSPRLREQIAGEGRRAALYNWLARVERRLYDQIPPPDIVLKLSVSIATMKNRNRERVKTAKDAEDYLEARHQQSGEWRKSGTKYLHDIDADHSLAETKLRVQKAIWQSL